MLDCHVPAMFVAHVTTAPTPLPVRFAVAVLAGLGAAALMNVPINALSHGNVPPRVTAAALWREPVDRVTASESAAVHYAAGMVAGALFELVVVLAERVTDVRVVVPGVAFAEVVAAILVAALAFAGFVFVVFPRAGETLYRDGGARVTVVRQWAVSAATFGVGMLVLVPVLYAVLPAG